MEHFEPQIALFQSVAVVRESNERLRLTANRSKATAPDTRFLCRFHSADDEKAEISFSEFDFNYEYVLWRKGKLPMYRRVGKDVSVFETSQLLFSCPIPKRFQLAVLAQPILLDIIPIRTPARSVPWLPEGLAQQSTLWSNKLGESHFLPQPEDSGRWSNLPVCAAPPSSKRRLVACTWTAAAYKRRGDSTQIDDTGERLREWAVFHNLVGVEHIYVYDNTVGDSPLASVAKALPFVTYIRWPASVCNNNRPNFRIPGERSSQYAAEASCRVRYGDSTEWMTFIDTDEYIIPANHSSWHDVLDDIGDKYDVLKMRSSRGRPRIKYMDALANQTGCSDKLHKRKKLNSNACFGRKPNTTFLELYK